MYKPKKAYSILGEENWGRLPQVVRDALLSIIDDVSDFHHQRRNAEIWVALRNRGIETKKRFEATGYSHRKEVNGYIEADHTRVVVEIESSTIENAYNDTLKILALRKAGQIDFGVILAKYNSKRRSLSYRQIKKSLWDPFRVLFDDRIAILCVE